MNTIKFHCQCGQPFESNPNAIGQSFDCPTCQKALNVPDKLPPLLPMPAHTRNKKVPLWPFIMIFILGLCFITAIVGGNASTTTTSTKPIEVLFDIGGNKHIALYEVLDVDNDGARICPSEQYTKDVFVYGLNGVCSDRSYRAELQVIPIGRITYKTVSGGSRTIPAYKLVKYTQQ